MKSNLKPGISNFMEAFQLQASQKKDKVLYTFLEDGEEEVREVSYAALDRMAKAIAAVLQKKGLEGERAILIYPPRH